MKIKTYLSIYFVIVLFVCILPGIVIRKVIIDLGNETDSSDTYIDSDITVFLSKENKNVIMKLEEYIKGVVSSEMPASYEMEALKAQAIVARTYTINKIKERTLEHPESDICDNISHCQAYISKEDRISKWNDSNQNSSELWNKIECSVNDTKGYIVTYQGEPIKAFFHANSGGMTEDVSLVWGATLEYLKAVPTIGENNYSQYSSNVLLTKQEFREKMKTRYPSFVIDFSKDDCIQIIDRSNSGRIQSLKLGNTELSGITLREILGLRSTNFTINVTIPNIEFNVIGYGHGVGMSQTGSNELAKNGYTYEDIIHHYYTGVELEKYY